MISLNEKKQKAHQLRKCGNYKDALSYYMELWQLSNDKFDGCGLLHCLRKLGKFEEALVLADELIIKYFDFEWCTKEVIWTYIEGVLNKIDVNEQLEKILDISNKILEMNPDNLAKKLVVYKVLKVAKLHNDWDTVNIWVVKIDPDILSTEPISSNSKILVGWSDQALWYNYRVNGLIKKGFFEDAIIIIDEMLGKFPRQRRFTLRLKALALYRLNDLPASLDLYRELCKYKSDWWLLCEYARVLRDSGLKEEALKTMYQASSTHFKLDSMVSLFNDIGLLCIDLKMHEEARAHLILCKKVREEEGWKIPELISENIGELNNLIDIDEPASLKEALEICRNSWKRVLGDNLNEYKSKITKGLVGKVVLGNEDRPFCFINSNEQSYFCYKSDLPEGILDKNEVIFDAIPSFDKKKNKQSLKAIRIKLKQ